jgi:hypothetical protein
MRQGEKKKKKEGRRGCNELVSVLRPADFLVRQADKQRVLTSLDMKSSSIYGISA